jgi:Fasciclin domain
LTLLVHNGHKLQVFAPSDDAIDKLGAGGLAYLLSTVGKSALIDLVSYHIVDSLHPSALIRQQQEEQLQHVVVPTMLMGRQLDMFVQANENGDGDDEKGIVLVNAGMAQVTSADNLAANGIIHLIDTVLEIPKTSSSNVGTTTTGPSYYYKGEHVVSDILGDQESYTSMAVATTAAGSAVARIIVLLLTTAAAAVVVVVVVEAW